MSSVFNNLRGIALGLTLTGAFSSAEAKENTNSDNNRKQDNMEVLAVTGNENIEVNCLIMPVNVTLNQYNAPRYTDGFGKAHFDSSSESIIIKTPKAANFDEFYEKYGMDRSDETGFGGKSYVENLDELSALGKKLQGEKAQAFKDHKQVKTGLHGIAEKYGVDLNEYKSKDDKKKDKYLKGLQSDGKIPYHQTRYDLKSFLEHANAFLQAAEKSEEYMNKTLDGLKKDSESSVLHEAIHEKNNKVLKEIFADIKVVSPEDKLNLHMADETAAFLATALSFRKDYVNATTPEQKKEALKKLHNVVPQYAEKIVKSEINPNDSKLSLDHLDKDMGALMSSVRQNIHHSYEAHYLKGANDNTTAYLAVVSGTSKAEKDKNYQQALEATLTLGGYDFSKHFQKYNFSKESKDYFAALDAKIVTKKDVIAENTTKEWHDVLVSRQQKRVETAKATEKENAFEVKTFKVKNPNTLLADAIDSNKSKTINWQQAQAMVK